MTAMPAPTSAIRSTTFCCALRTLKLHDCVSQTTSLWFSRRCERACSQCFQCIRALARREFVMRSELAFKLFMGTARTVFAPAPSFSGQWMVTLAPSITTTTDSAHARGSPLSWNVSLAPWRATIVTRCISSSVISFLPSISGVNFLDGRSGPVCVVPLRRRL